MVRPELPLVSFCPCVCCFLLFPIEKYTVKCGIGTYSMSVLGLVEKERFGRHEARSWSGQC